MSVVQVPPDSDRGSIVLFGAAPPEVSVAELVSLTVTVPVSPVPATGVVDPARETLLVNESPTAVGSPASGPVRYSASIRAA